SYKTKHYTYRRLHFKKKAIDYPNKTAILPISQIKIDYYRIQKQKSLCIAAKPPAGFGCCISIWI
ncbi:MAG TPA: hypothetical protein PK525_11785, partial [Anaerohalosphaeraceae bacterium]|nr:hypothetical protein [Anaerohalosphaeraceae bacterium]HPC65288.1 hypothetical protein [Anaerohalosphaeraceae bacterium]